MFVRQAGMKETGTRHVATEGIYCAKKWQKTYGERGWSTTKIWCKTLLKNDLVQKHKFEWRWAPRAQIGGKPWYERKIPVFLDFFWTCSTHVFMCEFVCFRVSEWMGGWVIDCTCTSSCTCVCVCVWSVCVPSFEIKWLGFYFRKRRGFLYFCALLDYPHLWWSWPDCFFCSKCGKYVFSGGSIAAGAATTESHPIWLHSLLWFAYLLTPTSPCRHLSVEQGDEDRGRGLFLRRIRWHSAMKGTRLTRYGHWPEEFIYMQSMNKVASSGKYVYGEGE